MPLQLLPQRLALTPQLCGGGGTGGEALDRSLAGSLVDGLTCVAGRSGEARLAVADQNPRLGCQALSVGAAAGRAVAGRALVAVSAAAAVGLRRGNAGTMDTPGGAG